MPASESPSTAFGHIAPQRAAHADAVTHMTDKHRQRPIRAPQGFLPNWVLVLFAACAMLLVGFAHAMM
jgi:hypothetical protein